MPIVKAAALYFALVFGAGVVLGAIRVLWAVPRFGARTAELIEMPVMLMVILLAARRVVRRHTRSPVPSRRLAIGLLALGFLLVMELTVVLWLQGLTIRGYLASRDSVAGAAYLVSLGLFTAMPLLAGRR